jgi:hypothetical protein
LTLVVSEPEILFEGGFVVHQGNSASLLQLLNCQQQPITAVEKRFILPSEKRET